MALRALVVGGTNGIGLGIANRLASTSASALVTISGRNKPREMPHPNMDFRRLDASSMSQIRSYADALKAESGPKLDLLVMSQGLMTMAGREETPEGIDNKMAIHYYGKQLLIRELLPMLKDDAKVVIVLDCLFGSPKKLMWDDLDLKHHYSLGKQSDHCLSMTDAMVQYWAADQAKQGLHKRHFVHAWPGGVRTNLDSGLPWYLRPVLRFFGAAIAVSPETCAEYLLEGVEARAAECEQQGGRRFHYINNKGRAMANKAPWTDEEVERVAEHTWKLVDQALTQTRADS